MRDLQCIHVGKKRETLNKTKQNKVKRYSRRGDMNAIHRPREYYWLENNTCRIRCLSFFKDTS